MKVSLEKVLQKMEQEITAAKNANPNDMEKHVYAIKSMCDLLMGIEKPVPTPMAAPAVIPQPVQQPVQVVGQPGRIATGDGSNGESIFDF
ncbi:YwdI family protein [Domibacillus tundrae]|uniref:YwdI family protein n=1 Tax=Domibacillus tundrae TaxID=1587527 RepID=UPI0033967036